jgi:hypothetical protein
MEQSMGCMLKILRINIWQNLWVYSRLPLSILGPVKFIEMFESFNTFEGDSCHM